MIVALFAGVNAPSPSPASASPASQPGGAVPERDLEQPDGGEDHPATGERAIADAVQQPPGDRSGDPDRDRQHRQLQPNQREAAVLGRQVVGHDEQRPEQDHVGDEPAAEPDRSARRRKIESSISGASTRRSRRTNAIAASNPERQRGQQQAIAVAGAVGEREVHKRSRGRECQQRSTELIAAAGSAPRAAARQQKPARARVRSRRRGGSRGRSAATRRAPATAPPTTGPSAKPSACAVPCTPIPRPSSGRGIASVIRATLLACNIAAPTACSTRAAISTGQRSAPGRTAPSRP